MMNKLLTLMISVFLPVLAFAQESSTGLEIYNSEKALASTVCEGKVVPINSIAGGGVLYKSSNLHGGRGPTFLVQNAGERTGKQVIEIRNARCEWIGSFGLYATDQPYGARYYTRSGGSAIDSNGLLAEASKVGSNNILVEGKDKWIRVKNPQNRDGSVRK